MPEPAETQLRLRAEDLTWRIGDDETIVFDHRRWVYLSLNGSGVVLWGALVGGARRSELEGLLVERYGIDAVAAERDVAGFLDHLLKQELLAPDR